MVARLLCRLSSDAANNEVVAGNTFTLLVDLSEQAREDLRVVFEKERVIAKVVGVPPQLRPTGMTYFAEGFEPGPVDIPRGRKSGELALQVLRDAQAGGGDPPIEFPEPLLLIAYVTTRETPVRVLATCSLATNILPLPGPQVR